MAWSGSTLKFVFTVSLFSFEVLVDAIKDQGQLVDKAEIWDF